ncbi:MAG: recombinase family protein [Chloroflexi bacterium]|nr:recombinase family protein [Chloroflexota bacterium]
MVYSRDSGGEEQDRSVIQQLEAIDEYCQHHHLVVEERYVDEARLSSNTEQREALLRMLNDLHGRFRRINDRYKREKLTRERPFGVIFWKSNRLGRDAIEATNIKSDLRLRGITVVDLITAATTGIMAVDSIIEAVQTTHDEMILEDISTSAKRGLAQLVGLRDTDETFLSHNPDWLADEAAIWA